MVFAVFWVIPLLGVWRAERQVPALVPRQVCADCEITMAEIAQAVRDVEAGKDRLTREEQIETFLATFANPEEGEFCLDCAEVVVDAGRGED